MWFDFAQSVATDQAGNVYFSALNCVFKLEGSGPQPRVRTGDRGGFSGFSGIVTRVAGNGRPGFSGDGGPAIAAQLNEPSGLAIDTSGTLLIADSGNDRIRKVSRDGVITTVAGDGAYGPSGDGGPATSAQLGMAWPPPGPPAIQPQFVAVDGAGNLFIADYGRIRKVSADGIINTVVENLSGPLTVDSVGNLFVANTNFIGPESTSVVVKVSPDGTTSTVAGGGPVSGNTLGWTGLGQNACVDDLSGDGGQATNAGLCQLTGLAVDRAGNLFVGEDFYYDPAGDNWAFVVRKVSSDGTIITVAGATHDLAYDGGPSTAGLIGWGGPVAVDGRGNLFITDDQDIRKISPDGIINTVAGRPVCAEGDSVCAQGDQAWRAQVHFSGDGGPATNAVLSSPSSLAADGAGNLFIRDAGNLRVRKVAPDGIITTVTTTLSPSTVGGTYPPAGLAVDGMGNLFIGEVDRVRRLSPDGMITTVAGSGTLNPAAADGGPATNALLNHVGGIATDAVEISISLNQARSGFAK